MMKHSPVKQMLSVLLSVVLALSCAAFAFAADGADLVISTAAELAAFAKAVDGGDTFAGKTVALGADIDLSGVANWNPIGIEKGSNGKFGTYTETDSVFAGTFDGRMHTVKGMTVTGSYSDMTLTEQKYQNGELDSSSAVELRASGYPTNSMAYDKVFENQEDVKAVAAISADTLNANLPAVNAVLAAYGYDTAVVAAQNFVTVNGAVYPAAIGAALQAKADAAAAAPVAAQIAQLGEVTLESEAAVTAARAAYNALTDAQKALVPNLATLTAAEATLAALQKAAADQAAAAAVDAKIAAIGEVSLDSEAAVAEARAAYDALTAEQKALVTKADDLTAAEDALADLKAAGQNDDADNNGGSEGTKTSLWQKILAFFRKIIDFFRNLFK